MNLFLLSRSRRRGAKRHCNRHVVKMILETTQLMWTAVHMSDVDMSTLNIRAYRKTHAWHPTAVWVRETPKNWEFAVTFGLALCTEYTRRFQKRHKCERHLHFIRKLGYCAPLETRPYTKPRGPMKGGCTPLPLAMPDECVVDQHGIPNAVASYRKYYNRKGREWAALGRQMRWPTSQTDWIVAKSECMQRRF